MAEKEDEDKDIVSDVRAVVEDAVAAVGRAGTNSAANVADAVEGAGRSLSRRMIDRAMAQPRHVPDQASLARALAEKPATPLLSGGTIAAMSSRVLKRLGPLKFLGRRTPAFLLASAVPALATSVSRGADELGLVAAHLVSRARAAGVEPDAERVRRVAVQVMTGAEVAPGSEPRHGPLMVAWLRRAARAALPFTSGVTTRDPDGLSWAASEVDPALLAAEPPSPGLPPDPAGGPSA